ncbi:MAG: hypothetical protein KME55_24510 [Nostoc indistinguendum CM1-VF10]|nr:hypothetical protein [Nostoc indistinguendum CM1-VF10]
MIITQNNVKYRCSFPSTITTQKTSHQDNEKTALLANPLNPTDECIVSIQANKAQVNSLSNLRTAITYGGRLRHHLGMGA